MADRVFGFKLVFILHVFSQFAAQPMHNDPCLWYTKLSDPLRSPLHRPRMTDMLLCDRYLLPGWYRFVDGTIPTRCIEAFKCGTQAPIWMNGTVPRFEDGIVDRTACVNVRSGLSYLGSCCSIRLPIQVRNCGEFVIYNLRNAPGCPMSYCVESQPNLQISPRLSGPEIIGNNFRFACSLDVLNEGSDVGYDITWSFDNQPIRVVSQQTRIGSKIISYLGDKYWKGNVGKTLRCHCRTFYRTMPSVKSHPHESNGYWGGMSISPSSVMVSENGGEQELNITCTLPILCQHNLPCAIHLNMDVHGGSWDELTSTRNCQLAINREDWNSVTKSAMTYTRIMATNDFIDDGDQELTVNFHPDYNLSPALYGGYSFPGAKVVTIDAVTSRCYAFSDPHIRGLERVGMYHLYEAGDFVFLRNKIRPFEIQIRSWACAGRGCICAVAVREGNDLITVDICDNTGTIPAKVRVLSGSTVDPGTTIQRSRDGQTYMITLASGNWIKVTDFRSYLNVEVQATSKDFGSLEGICGTFDNNARNEFLSPSGTLFSDANEPVEFLRSWRIPAEHSLFTGHFTRVSMSSTSVSSAEASSQQCLCKASHGLMDCGQSKRFQDPNKLTVNNYNDITINVINSPPDDRIIINQISRNNQQQQIPIIPQYTFNISTEQQARDLCIRSIINITIGVSCVQTLNIQMTGYIESCVHDTMLAGNDFFLKGMVASFEANCQEKVLRNASNYKEDDDGRRVAPPAATTLMCPNQCSLRGICGDGLCRCEPGYTGVDCSVVSSSPPVIILIKGYGVCDFKVGQCNTVDLIVDNYMETPNGTCLFQKENDINILVPQQTAIRVPAIYQSNREVTCRLPGTFLTSGEAISRYYISISIDGVSFSNNKLYLIYNSDCIFCLYPDNCTQKIDTCVINNKCWIKDDVNPLINVEICNPDVNKLAWTLNVSQTQPPPIIVPHIDTRTCPCVKEQIYERWDIWTSNRTGCPCDSTDAVGRCACCEIGGCRCSLPNQNQCTQCGNDPTACSIRKFVPEFGIDAWTLKTGGCQCPFDPDLFNCACCQNGACHCGTAYRNQCAPCWYPELCGTKRDVFGIH